MSEYTSSIVNNYGDSDRVQQDVKALNDIISRQGIGLLLDVVAEYIGNLNAKFKWTAKDIANIKNCYTSQLIEAINERT